MSCLFVIKDGKLTNVKYNGGDFNCSKMKLTSLGGCPQKVDMFDCSKNQLVSLKGGPQDVDVFDCSFNQLTSLEGGPKKVGIFNCSDNQLTSLKGIGAEVSISLVCSNNPDLEDISDIPSSSMSITIQHCSKIKKFPQKIDTMLAFVLPTGWVRRRIKKIPFYEVLEEDEYSITVRKKNIGIQLLDNL